MLSIPHILADWPTPSIAPPGPVPLWLLVGVILPAIGAAMAVTVALYFQQRRMAPARTVAILTTIRLVLFLLLIILLFQPGLRWLKTNTRNGTLWVIVDQSPSMSTPDPQATPIERMRWVEGMGLITPRENPPDELRGRAYGLMAELTAILDGQSGGEDRAATRALADSLGAWSKQVRDLQSEVDDRESEFNSAAPRAGTDARQALDRAYSMAQGDLSAVRNATRVRDAVNAFNRNGVTLSLAQARDALGKAAAAGDPRYLASKASDGNFRTADGRVVGLTRQQLAYEFLTSPQAPASKVLEELAKNYHLRIASFSDKTQAAVAVDADQLPGTLRAALTASGQATNLAAALQYVNEQISGDDAAAVVVLSDGRHNTAGDPRAAARNLASRGVNVYGLLVGSHEVSPDAAVELPVFPEWIYKGDTFRPRATIRLDGLQGKNAIVELRRAGIVLDRRQMTVASGRETRPFEFTDSPPDSATVLEYEIRVNEMAGEVNTQNNVATFRVAIKKDKLYALILEDRPRWEFRYLASYFTRRQGLKTQTVLLQPATVGGVGAPLAVMASPDNPKDEAQLLPATLADWQKFDLILIGDISPDILTPQIQQFIAATVRDKGATLITIAGQRSMPAKYSGTPLSEILPISLSTQWTPEQIARHTRTGFQPAAAPLAGASALVLLESDPATNARAWSNVPAWYWHSPFTEIKPASTPVWTIQEAAGRGPRPNIADANHHALLSHITVGLGRSLHIASDQTWRLRQVGGANLHDRFWGQVINWAVGSDLPAGGKYVRFGAGHSEYEQSQPVVITARVLKEDLTPYQGLTFSAVARPVQTPGTPAPPQNAVEAFFEPMESPGHYQATLAGLPAGDLEISLRGAQVERLLNEDPTATIKTLRIKVFPTLNAERRNMNTDPDMLDKVALDGHGYSLDAQYAHVLLSRLPKIERKEVSETQLGFFRDPTAKGTQYTHLVFLLAFVLLITIEWALRKRAGLV